LPLARFLQEAASNTAALLGPFLQALLPPFVRSCGRQQTLRLVFTLGHFSPIEKMRHTFCGLCDIVVIASLSGFRLFFPVFSGLFADC
jgi:hypothetical protein